MRKLVLALPIALLSFSCANFTWRGQGSGTSVDGVRDIAALESSYETKQYWAAWRRRQDGRTNAFGRGLDMIVNSVDRHFFNYSTTDPAVNYPTEQNLFSKTGGFVGRLLAW